MPVTPTYVSLGTITLASSASDVTFSSIPASFRDLVLVIDATFSGAAEFRLQFNADTGNNYSYVYALGKPTTSTESSSGTVSGLRLGNASTANRTSHIVNIMDYSATDKHTTAVTRSNDAAGLVWMFAGRWANTSAITSIKAYQSSGTISSGSTFSLFGIAA